MRNNLQLLKTRQNVTNKMYYLRISVALMYVHIDKMKNL